MNYNDSVRNLIGKTKDYFETSVEVAKLKTIKTSADVLSTVTMLIIIIFTSSLVLIFFSIALALYLGLILGDPIYGFFIIGGFYSLILLLYLLRQKLIKIPIATHLINNMLN